MRISRSGRGLTTPARAVGQLLFVVDDEQIAQRPVDQVEAHVRAELLQIGVVLQQRVEKRPGVERVADARGDQVGRRSRASVAGRLMSLRCSAVSNVRWYDGR